jgi:hypothetical protein
VRPLAPAALAAVFAALAAPAMLQAQDSSGVRREFWPEADVYWQLTPSTKALFVGALHRAQEIQYAEGELSLYVDHRVSRPWSLRAGAGYHESLSDTTYRERRGVAEATYHARLPAKWRLLDRNRVDLRWRDDFSWRYRNRARAERTHVFASGRALTYGLQFELFWTASDRAITRTETRATVEWRYAAVASIQGELVRQRDRDDALATDALGVVLALHF